MINSIVFSIFYVVLYLAIRRITYKKSGGPQTPSKVKSGLPDRILEWLDNAFVCLVLAVVAVVSIGDPLYGLAVSSGFGLLLGNVHGMFRAQRELAKLNQKSAG